MMGMAYPDEFKHLAPPSACWTRATSEGSRSPEEARAIRTYDGTVADENFLLKTLTGPLRR